MAALARTSLNRKELAREIEELLGLDSTMRTKTNGRKYTQHAKGLAIIRAVLKSIVDGLHRGESVTIKGFGKFSLVRRAPRKAPLLLDGNGHGAHYTGASITVPARTVVVFRPSRSLEAWVNLDREGTLNADQSRAVASWNLNGNSDSAN